jgi:SAM-dependent methyltransferase
MGYGHYLAAKKSVDDRSINRHVLDRLRTEIGGPAGYRVRVVEIGAGLGTMVARLVDTHVLTQAEYLLLDVDPRLLMEARAWLAGWADSRRLLAVDLGESLHIHGEPGVDVVIRFAAAELGEFLSHSSGAQPADLLVANALLDLVDVAALLPKLLSLLVPNGLYFFAVNFDGETIFEPEHPDDELLLEVYHRSMDERVRYGVRAGDSRCGRHLFGHLRAAGATILAAGASDWIVHPQNQRYPDDEAYFLRAILDTIGDELRRQPDVRPEVLDAWLALRRQQTDRAELVYIAHQIDFVGRRAGAETR